MTHVLRPWTLGLLSLLAGCTAHIASPDGAGDGAGSLGPGSAPVDSAAAGPGSCGADQILPARVWRLTADEYRTSIQQVLELEAPPEIEIEVDPIVDGFKNNASALSVSTRLAAQLQKAAASLSGQGLSLFSRHSGCQQTALSDEACVSKFVETLGRRVFRRPLTADEVAGYIGVYRAGVADEHAAHGVRLVVETLLQSPSFLYRSELGDVGTRDDRGIVRLDPFELASALSYSLWGRPPDETLTTSAATGALTGAGELDAQARRLLTDARARPRLAQFASRWLALQEPANLVRAPEQFPDFEASKVQLFLEFDQLAQSSFLDPGATLASVFFNPATAAIEPNRVGLLTSSALIASWSRDEDTAPMTRAKNFLNRVLCQTLPPPPAELQIPAVPRVDTATTRERFEVHAQNPGCAGCHDQLDSVAFALEHFDSIGRYRDTENGKPVNASGVLSGGDFAGPFTNMGELAQRLASSGDARVCLARQYARFVAGTGSAGDSQCLIDAMTEAVAANSDSPVTLMLTLITSDYFKARRAAQ